MTPGIPFIHWALIISYVDINLKHLAYTSVDSITFFKNNLRNWSGNNIISKEGFQKWGY